jgi:UrcA family protein
MLERASIVVPENFHSGIQSWRSIVMRIRTTALLLVTGSIGLAFAGSASAASCGTYGGYDPKPPPESVTITAPRVQMERPRLNTTPGRVTLSQPVQYADLNLCTASGAAALRERVALAATSVCNQLAATYPHAMNGSPSCYRESMDNAQPKVDFAIDDTRGLR